MKRRVWNIVRNGLVLCALVAAMLGVHQFIALASRCSVWYQCPETLTYGAPSEYGGEHGIDLLTGSLPITARLPGVVSYVGLKKWEYPWVEDITWKLSTPACHWGKCEPYAYVQVRANSQQVRVGQHVTTTTVLGYSNTFIEFGLTPDWAYGTSNWRWGMNPGYLVS